MNVKPRPPRPARPPRPSGEPGPKVRPARSGAVHVEIVAVGRELLRGHVAESNSRDIAETLARRGALVHRVTIVDDLTRAVAAALREALDRNPHLVVTTGGLGPAADDRTLEGVAEALELPLTLHAQARAMVEAAYQRLYEARVVRAAGMTLTREKMARLPVGAIALGNRRGVAPGVLCRLSGGGAVLCLPGSPDQAREVLDEALPLLGDLTPRVAVSRREIESPTSDESSLRPMLEMLSSEFGSIWVSSRPVGPGEHGHKILITLEATALTREEANGLVESAVRRLLALAAGSP